MVTPLLYTKLCPEHFMYNKLFHHQNDLMSLVFISKLRGLRERLSNFPQVIQLVEWLNQNLYLGSLEPEFMFLTFHGLLIMLMMLKSYLC